MRQPAYRKANRGASVSSAYALKSPTGGLNKRDSIASMPEGDALIMDNCFPETNDIRVRRGYSNHLTGMSEQAESLMVYNEPDGTQTLFVAEGTDFFNATSAGSVGSAVVSSLTNARWQSLNFTISGGTSYLCCFNGVDAPRYWNGSSWLTITDASTPAITGVTTTGLVSGWAHKRRIWLVEADKLGVWYLPVDAVGGAAKYLDLGGIATRGGYVMAGGTWTVDAGSGVDDFWVCITSEGQLIAYQGTDPSSASTWAHVGTWNIGQPIGRRCMHQFKGDLLVINVEGVTSVARVIGAGATGDSSQITDKISADYKELVTNYSANFGWDMCYYPKADMLILNVPVEEGVNQYQYAMNTNTGAWGGPWKAIDANAWTIFGEEPYFAANTLVAKFWNQDSDAGQNIFFDIQQAFSNLGSPGLIKKVSMLKPLFKSTAAFSVVMGVNADYQIKTPTGSVSGPGDNVVTINTTKFGDQAVWGGSLSLDNNWEAASAVGSTIGPRLKGAVNGAELRYLATDMVFETGGIIG